MADSVRLKLGYKDALGNARNFTFSNAKEDASESDVQALSAGLIANGGIFANPPVTAVDAYIVKTTETEIDLA